MNSKQKNAERLERKQQKLDAAPVSARYPDVTSIVIAMDYYRRGSSPPFMQRIINFLPGSAAYFLMECMEDKCTHGGFNLESIIYTMVKNRQESTNGELVCSGSDSSCRRRIAYKIAIQYN
ncbi:MAG: hypothetical protein K8I29_03145 [Alphaproteobacteria bacterium]|uniref:Uncharacterized protein n=1 Tax=Candidatus Nitrobium versatile TaxID=2884831 RepID=A0A953LZ69_9BACT|nr:hypothetical protein [Candidatus Nitrobium versatile]